MIGLISKVFIGVGTVAAVATGATVAVKKNEKIGSFYDKKAPKVVQVSCKKVETVSVDSYKKTANKTKSAWLKLNAKRTDFMKKRALNVVATK